ncbi:MAG: hypothetical protein FJ096_00905 [Deltaproteobacteria bacterium]|nr:hypothetical protein [Deltaproteobacteria bacterium]
MLTGFSLAASILPIPFLPDRVLRQVRGVVAHESASRHGISLTTDARAALSEPQSEDAVRNALRKGVELLVRRVLRRIGPLAPLASGLRAFEVYALGHLLERYFGELRRSDTVRLGAEEATSLREAIDEAVLRTFHPATTPRRLLLGEGVEDLRDEFTRWIDSLLIAGATLPSYLVRRLDAAFDEALAARPSLRSVEARR